MNKTCGRKSSALIRAYTMALVIVSFALLLLAHFFAFNLTLFGFPISNPEFDYLKLRDFIFGNGQLVLAFSIIGIIGLSFRSRHHMDMTMCLAYALLLFLYFFPVYWTYRFFPEISVFMVYPVLATFSYILRWAKARKFNQSTRKLIGAVLVLALFISAFLPVWYRFSYRNANMPDIGWQSFNSMEEVQIASFIRQNTPPDSVIISDYFTMYTLTPLSNRIWIGDKFMGPESSGLSETLATIKYNILLAPNSSYAYDNIMQLMKSLPFDEQDYIDRTQGHNYALNALIIISPRTDYWVRQADMGFSLSLSSTVDPYILRIFNNDEYFEQLFSIGDYCVYEAKLGVTVEEHNPEQQAVRFLDPSAIKIENSENSSFALPFSIEFLFNAETSQGDNSLGMGDLISKGSNFQVKIANGSSEILVDYYGANEWQKLWLSLPTSIADSWHHLVVIFDSENSRSQILIYLDGQLMKSEILDGIPADSGSPVFIGSFGLQSGVEQYRGLVGIVRLYQIALTSSQVQYNFGHLDNPITQGLYAWYDMSNITDTVPNLSGNGGNGIIIGAQWIH